MDGPKKYVGLNAKINRSLKFSSLAGAGVIQNAISCFFARWADQYLAIYGGQKKKTNLYSDVKNVVIIMSRRIGLWEKDDQLGRSSEG